MGRRERPLGSGPLCEFARDLRALREQTGLTYRELGRRAGYSASALSAAASGHALPTLTATLNFVRACGGDLEHWQQRWHQLRGTSEAAIDQSDDHPSGTSGAHGHRVPAPVEHFAPLRPGDPASVGQLRLLARIAAGATARLYLARHPDGSPVAVRIVHADLADDPQLRRRFTAEVTLLRQVHGPGVTAVIAADPSADRPWLATPYTPAVTLADVVGLVGRLPTDTVWRLAADLADALATLHEAGIHDRQPGPEGVLLAAAGATLDTTASAPSEPATDTLDGPLADVHALGRLLAYAATGGAPDLTRLTSVDNNLADLIADCLDNNPAARPDPAEIIDRCVRLDPSIPGQSWLPPPVVDLVTQRHTAMVAVLARAPVRWRTRPVGRRRWPRMPHWISPPLLILLAAGVISAVILDTGAGYRTETPPPAGAPSPPSMTATSDPAPTMTYTPSPTGSTTPTTADPATGAPPVSHQPVPAPAKPNPPQAAPVVASCIAAPSRAACDTRDPVATSCAADAVTVPGGQFTTILHGAQFQVELRWSGRCQTTWAQVQSLDGPVAFQDWSEPDRHDATRYFSGWTTATGPIQSPMSFSDGGKTAAAACVMVTGAEQPYYDCTPRLLPDGTNVGDA